MKTTKLKPPDKALSVLEPWAWAIVANGGWKSVENRTWSTAYRGPLALHASSARRGEDYFINFENLIDTIDPAIFKEIDDPRINRQNQVFRYGCILGVVDLVDVIAWKASKSGPSFRDACFAAGHRAWYESRRTEPRHWADGESGYCWLLGDVVQFAQPIPAKGALNLWKLQPDLAAKVAAALTRGPHGSPVAFQHNLAVASAAAEKARPVAVTK